MSETAFAPITTIGWDIAKSVFQVLAIVTDRDDLRIPADARVCLEMLAAQLAVLTKQVLENDRRIRASARETEIGRRLMEIPRVGPLLASASLPVLLILACSEPVVTWPHGPALCQSKTRAAARSLSAASR